MRTQRWGRALMSVLIVMGLALAAAGVRAAAPVSFSAPVNYALDNPEDLSVADMDNDGKLDIVCGTHGNLAVFYGNGLGTFTKVDYAAESAEIAVAIGVDVNNDTLPDLIF